MVKVLKVWHRMIVCEIIVIRMYLAYLRHY